MSPGSNGEPSNPTSSFTFPQLLQAIADPSTSEIPLENLKRSLFQSSDRKDVEQIKTRAIELVKRKFLSPVRDLSEDLHLWQIPNPITIPLPTPHLPLAPPTHTLIPHLTGLSGTFSHWIETYAPPPAPSGTSSSSMDRAPTAGGMGMTFVRGKGGNVPFRPGGMEDEAYVDREAAEQDYEEGEDPLSSEEAADPSSTPAQIWRTAPPGLNLPRTHPGISNMPQDADAFLRSILGEEEFRPKIKRKRRFPAHGVVGEGENGGNGVGVRNGADDRLLGSSGAEGEAAGRGTRGDIDDLLPISRLPAPPISRRMKKVAKREWAHVVDVNQELLNFHELVPDMAHTYPFELDTFQKEAVYHLEAGDSVFVAAHTSAGKTVVAEYAIGLSMKHMTRAIYTSPIKALSNQKFRDFKTTFGAENVGILTGDVQINPEGACLIMTTEILRSMLYKGADLIRDVEFVIFDEVHYVNDAERGVVWEEVIIMLPEHVNIILLSATVPNTKEFAAWVGRTKKRDIYVISTPKRPVPLEHYLWAGKEMHKIVDAKGQFLGEGYKAAGESLRRKQEKEREAAGLPPLQRTGGRGMPTRGGAKMLPNGRGGGGGAGRGAPAPRGRGGGNTGVTSFGAPRGAGGASLPDKNLWSTLINHLRKIDLLPVVVFTFSKKRCEENAASLSGTDLCVASEKSEVHITVERALTRLKGSDKKLPQIARMRELLNRGIGVHHGGLLPIVKEVVEILFARGLVKVLFATETFAMGVNMPAKSVVFSGTRKHDGHSFRELTPGEYTQMAGRAGRRGLDTTGTVIITSDGELPEASTLTTMMLGTPNKLTSQFRLTYNMILNLLRVEALRVEEMIKRSFSENASQSLAPEQQKRVAVKEKLLASLDKVDCEICASDIRAFYDISAELVRLNAELVQTAAANQQGAKSFAAGRTVLLYDTHFPGNLAIVLRPAAVVARPETASAGRSDVLRSFHVLALVSPATKSGENDLETVIAPPYWPARLEHSDAAVATWELSVVDTSSMNLVLGKTVKVDSVAILDQNKEESITQATQHLASIQRDLIDLPTLPEIEWSRMRTVEFQELLRQRDRLRPRLNAMSCRLCGEFDAHYETLHEVKLVEADLIQLKLMLSDQNLELLPDYEQRVDVLKQLKFIDDNATVLLKGRVACEINSANELILTEVILENILAPYTAAEAVALLSIFVFVEKSQSAPEIPAHIQEGLRTIYQLAESIEAVQDLNKVAHDEFQSKFKPGLVEVVFEWARGMPFDKITELTDVPEGTIVRCITRLDETCREVRDAARVIGDRELFAKMEEAQGLIRRDIVFAASLYF